jgi:hypothetical protein
VSKEGLLVAILGDFTQKLLIFVGYLCSPAQRWVANHPTPLRSDGKRQQKTMLITLAILTLISLISGKNILDKVRKKKSNNKDPKR